MARCSPGPPLSPLFPLSSAPTSPISCTLAASPDLASPLGSAALLSYAPSDPSSALPPGSAPLPPPLHQIMVLLLYTGLKTRAQFETPSVAVVPSAPSPKYLLSLEVDTPLLPLPLLPSPYLPLISPPNPPPTPVHPCCPPPFYILVTLLFLPLQAPPPQFCMLITAPDNARGFRAGSSLPR